MSGYSGSAFPGRLWGETEGFGGFADEGQAVTVIGPLPMSVSFVSLGEREQQVTHEGSEHVLKYAEWRLASLHRRLENCGVDVAGDSPGIDFAGPSSTVNMGPTLMNLPIYVSLPLFDNSSASDLESMNAGQAAVPYHPGDRVEILRCEGSAWCDDRSAAKFRSYLQVEPEWGIVFEGWFTMQTNVRLGHGPAPSLLHPNLQDVLVPVFLTKMGVALPSKHRAGLAQLQGAPDTLQLYLALSCCLGALLAGCGTCCSIFGLVQARKTEVRRGSPSGESSSGAGPTVLTSSAPPSLVVAK